MKWLNIFREWEDRKMSFLGKKIWGKDKTKSADSNDWVYLGETDNYAVYYKSSSVEVDHQNNIIGVVTQHVFSDEGKIDFLNRLTDVDRQKHIDINHSLLLYYYQYKERKYVISKLTDYSKLGDVIYDCDYPLVWKKITPDTLEDYLLNKLFQGRHI